MNHQGYIVGLYLFGLALLVVTTHTPLRPLKRYVPLAVATLACFIVALILVFTLD
jgi:hypothetical protein